MKNTEKDIHKNHRSRVKQKFLQNGLDSFAPHEVLELALFYTIPLADTNKLAHRLIKKYGNLSGVCDANFDSLLEVDGISHHTATFLKLLPSLFSEYSKSKTLGRIPLNCYEDAKNFVKTLFDGASSEQFYIICIDSSNAVKNVRKIASGDSTKVEVPIRKVTDYIFKNNCNRVILAHNHPLGKASPSDEDFVLTHKLFNSCVLNEIDILDHIICSREDVYCFAERGDMDRIKRDVLALLKVSPDSLRYKRFCMPQNLYGEPKDSEIKPD